MGKVININQASFFDDDKLEIKLEFRDKETGKLRSGADVIYEILRAYEKDSIKKGVEAQINYSVVQQHLPPDLIRSISGALGHFCDRDKVLERLGKGWFAILPKIQEERTCAKRYRPNRKSIKKKAHPVKQKVRQRPPIKKKDMAPKTELPLISLSDTLPILDHVVLPRTMKPNFIARRYPFAQMLMKNPANVPNAFVFLASEYGRVSSARNTYLRNLADCPEFIKAYKEGLVGFSVTKCHERDPAYGTCYRWGTF